MLVSESEYQSKIDGGFEEPTIHGCCNVLGIYENQMC